MSSVLRNMMVLCLLICTACAAQVTRNPVRQDAYGAAWNGDLYRAPSADAVYDAFAALPAPAPGGADTQVQYNNAGAFAGDAGMTYAQATDVLSLNGGLSFTTTTTNALGILYKGANAWLHDFHHPTGGGVTIPDGYNICLGHNAGNFTMGSTATVTLEASRNVLIGLNAGTAMRKGYENVNIGADAGTACRDAERNVIIGSGAGEGVIDGDDNVFIGYEAGHLSSGSTCGYNVAIGHRAGYDMTTAGNCVLIGRDAGQRITYATYNVCLGGSAGEYITSGAQNICLGRSAGNSITTGNFNICAGYGSGPDADAEHCISMGWESMGAGTCTGDHDLVFGYQAGRALTSADYNILLGYQAASAMTTGDNNVVLGNAAGGALTSGNGNIVAGYRAEAGDSCEYSVILGYDAGSAGMSQDFNVGIGYLAGNSLSTGASNVLVGPSVATNMTTGYYNTCLGLRAGDALVSGHDTICIGHEAGDHFLQADNADGCIIIGEGTYSTASDRVVLGGWNSASTYLQGACEIRDGEAGITETLTNGALTAGTDWTAANDCTLNNDEAQFVYNTGAVSTLTQAEADLATPGVGERWYKLTYTVTDEAGNPTAHVTTDFAQSGWDFPIDVSANGTYETYFRSDDTPGDFVIESTLTAGQRFDLDGISLKECPDGDLYVQGDLTTHGDLVLTNGTNTVTSSLPAGMGSDYTGSNGNLVLDDGANWRVTLVIKGGLIVSVTTAGTTAATATWTAD